MHEQEQEHGAATCDCQRDLFVARLLNEPRDSEQIRSNLGQDAGSTEDGGMYLSILTWPVRDPTPLSDSSSQARNFARQLKISLPPVGHTCQACDDLWGRDLEWPLLLAPATPGDRDADGGQPLLQHHIDTQLPCRFLAIDVPRGSLQAGNPLTVLGDLLNTLSLPLSHPLL